MEPQICRRVHCFIAGREVSSKCLILVQRCYSRLVTRSSSNSATMYRCCSNKLLLFYCFCFEHFSIAQCLSVGCSIYPGMCMCTCVGFNRSIVLYVNETPQGLAGSGSHTAMRAWMHHLTTKRENMLVATHPHSQYLFDQLYSIESVHVPPYAVHSNSEWLPASANHFLVHEGRAQQWTNGQQEHCLQCTICCQGSKFRLENGQGWPKGCAVCSVCLRWERSICGAGHDYFVFKRDLFAKVAKKLPKIHLQRAFSEASAYGGQWSGQFGMNQDDGTGTWEKFYTRLTGLIYIPYNPTTSITAQLYRLHIPTFVPSVELLRHWVGNPTGNTSQEDYGAARFWNFNDFKPGIMFFSSADDLLEKLQSTNSHALIEMSLQMRRHSSSHCEKISSLWKTFLARASSDPKSQQFRGASGHCHGHDGQVLV